MIAISAAQRSGLRFTNPQGGEYDLGADPGWAPIPGTSNEGILFFVPNGKCGESIFVFKLSRARGVLNSEMIELALLPLS